MPLRRKKTNSDPVLSSKAWLVWKACLDAASAEGAEKGFREQADAAVEAGRMDVFREMLDVRDELLAAARTEFAQIGEAETGEELEVHQGMGDLFLAAARILRRAAQLSSLGAAMIEDDRLLKVIDGGRN